MLAESDIARVQGTFEAVAAQPEQAAALFYARLFEIDPSLRPLFPSDMQEQGRKLMAMLTAVVRGLNDLPAIVPVAVALSKRHVGYGVEPAHYETVGAALLDTLSAALGPRFDDDTRTAWTRTYGLLAQVMIGAAAV